MIIDAYATDTVPSHEVRRRANEALAAAGEPMSEVTYDALRKRIAELEAALRKVAEWERLLGLADSWITAAIECKEWRWDADQHEAATLTRDEIRAALTGGKP